MSLISPSPVLFINDLCHIVLLIVITSLQPWLIIVTHVEILSTEWIIPLNSLSGSSMLLFISRVLLNLLLRHLMTVVFASILRSLVFLKNLLVLSLSCSLRPCIFLLCKFPLLYPNLLMNVVFIKGGVIWLLSLVIKFVMGFKNRVLLVNLAIVFHWACQLVVGRAICRFLFAIILWLTSGWAILSLRFSGFFPLCPLAFLRWMRLVWSEIFLVGNFFRLALETILDWSLWTVRTWRSINRGIRDQDFIVLSWVLYLFRVFFFVILFLPSIVNLLCVFRLTQLWFLCSIRLNTWNSLILQDVSLNLPLVSSSLYLDYHIHN